MHSSQNSFFNTLCKHTQVCNTHIPWDGIYTDITVVVTVRQSIGNNATRSISVDHVHTCFNMDVTGIGNNRLVFSIHLHIISDL